MSKVYVPIYNTNNCVSVIDKDTIRVYENIPTFDTSIAFTDYFINSHYLEKKGTITYTSGEIIPTCLITDEITTDFYYRNDIIDILVVFFIILILCIYFPYRIIARLFGRWLKV